MPAKNVTLSTNILKLLFNAVPIPQLADNAVSNPFAFLYVALHTSNPSFSGTQGNFEVAYGGYSRVGVPRSAAGWVVAGTTVNPTGVITFPQCASGSSTATHWSIGTDATSINGPMLYCGPLNAPLSITSLVTPTLEATTSVTES